MLFSNSQPDCHYMSSKSGAKEKLPVWIQLSRCNIGGCGGSQRNAAFLWSLNSKTKRPGMRWRGLFANGWRKQRGEYKPGWCSHSISWSTYLFIRITTFKISNISESLPYLLKSLSDDLTPTSEVLLPCHNSWLKSRLVRLLLLMFEFVAQPGPELSLAPTSSEWFVAPPMEALEP